MASYWSERGHAVTLVTLDSEATDFYAVQAERIRLDLTWHSRGLPAGLVSNARRIRAIRAALSSSRPDVIISFLDVVNLLVIASSRGLGVPVVVSERNDPTAHEELDRLRTLLRPVLYRRAAAVVVQTHAVAEWAQGFLPADRVFRIPNPVYPPPASPEADFVPPARPVVTGLGRLHQQKGFDLLMRAFAACAAHRPGWHLAILGEGNQRDRLERLAVELGIRERVALPGTVRHPVAALQRSDLFVLSSRYEGFPNALLEAMSCGLPVVSFDCPSGPSEIVRHGVDGLLVPPQDEKALAEAMGSLMDDATERRRLGERALDVKERFAIDAIMARWSSVVERVTGRAFSEGAPPCAV
jgi:glycosyltransferase involved in cell wall biosynthesis